MKKPQIGMKHSTEQNGIEFQYPDLQDIKQFEMGVLDAAVHFDIDNRATLLIYDKMGTKWTTA